MTDKQTLKNQIETPKEFNPIDDIDVAYINEITNLIPDQGIDDLHTADILATKFLRCADYLETLLAQATRHLQRSEINMKQKKVNAIEAKIKDFKISPTAAKEMYANDTDYMKAASKHADALAWQEWIKNKHDNLIRAHIFCKDSVKRFTSGQQQSNWSGGFDPTEPSPDNKITKNAIDEFDDEVFSDSQKR